MEVAMLPSTAASASARLNEGPASVVEPSRPTLTSEGAAETAGHRSSRAKTEPRSGSPVVAAANPAVKPKPASSSGAWLVKALLAFAVSYAVVSYYKASIMHSNERVPAPATAPSR
jgi:hypothetical protein